MIPGGPFQTRQLRDSMTEHSSLSIFNMRNDSNLSQISKLSI